MTESTKTLVAKRGLIKAQLTCFRTYLSTFQEQPNQTKEYLQTRLEKAEKLWDKFEDVQGEIDELDEAAEQNVERLAFESSYFDTISSAKTILSQITRDTTSVTVTNELTSSRQITDTKSQVRLPKIDMPTFSGAYDEWMQIYDMFNTLIHTNTDLTPIQRFQYLRSSLKGEAAQVISSLEMSTGNYDIARKLLKERFDNKRIIVNNHVKALFELPVVTKESYVSTRQLLSSVQKHLRSLNALNLPTEQWDVLIIHLICTKLDVASRKEWENKASGTEIPTMEKMFQFLTKRAQVLESLHTNTNKTTQLKITNFPLKSRTTEQSVSCVTATACCSYCQKSQHALYKCYKFIGLPVKTRIEEAIRMRVCFNCLRSGHRATECHSSTCQMCQRKHNTLLHQDEVKPREKSAPTSAQKHSTEENPDGHSVTLTCNVNHNQIVLPTALVKVFDTNNTCYIVRALLDTGSQSNFISNKLCAKLKPNLFKSNVTISGLNQVVSKTSARCDIMIKSLNESFSTNITCLVVSQITNNMPVPAIQSSRVRIPPNLELADPSFNETKDIDMLLGAATFFDVLWNDRITYGRNQPVLQNTLLGWIVAGTVTSSQPGYTDSANLLCITEDQLQKGIERFWELEETFTAENYSKDERDCENHFTQTFKRAEDGRFILEMPLRNTVNQLGETRDIALKRIESVERRFKKNPHLREDYVQFMREYEELGHMTRCTESPHDVLHYLPHHPVIKEDSLTTKLRVVFDASAQPANGLSLNQI